MSEFSNSVLERGKRQPGEAVLATARFFRGPIAAGQFRQSRIVVVAFVSLTPRAPPPPSISTIQLLASM